MNSAPLSPHDQRAPKADQLASQAAAAPAPAPAAPARRPRGHNGPNLYNLLIFTPRLTDQDELGPLRAERPAGRPAQSQPSRAEQSARALRCIWARARRRRHAHPPTHLPARARAKVKARPKARSRGKPSKAWPGLEGRNRALPNGRPYQLGRALASAAALQRADRAAR